MDTRYLKKRGHTWSVIVAVPVKLQKAAGRDHFVKSLGTRDLAEANRRKHYWIAEFKRRIEALQRKSTTPDRDELIAVALHLKELLDRNKHVFTETPWGDLLSEYDELVSEVKERAQVIAETDPEAAERFHEAALGRATFIGDLWPQWLSEIEVAEHTKVKHAGAVKQFIEWAGDKVTVEEIDRRRAGAYASHLLAQGGARITVRNKLQSLASLWRWFEQRGITERNPWLRLGIKTKVTTPHKSFTDDQLVTLLSAPAKEPIYSLMRIAMLTGARIEELCSLKVEHVVEREDGWWLIVEKGKTTASTREVPLHPLAVPLIGEHLFDMPEIVWGKRSIYASKSFGRFRKRIGLGERGLNFHALRKTFIAMMEGEGVAESTVKLLVGHKRASMTYGYYSKGERVNLREAIERVRYSEEVMKLLALPREGPVALV